MARGISDDTHVNDLVIDPEGEYLDRILHEFGLTDSCDVPLESAIVAASETWYLNI